MGLPGKRLSRSSKRRRAAHFALEKVQLAKCPKCKKETMPHIACQFCGTYKTREAIKTKLPKGKKTEEVKKEKASTKEVKQ